MQSLRQARGSGPHHTQWGGHLLVDSARGIQVDSARGTLQWTTSASVEYIVDWKLVSSKV